MWCPWWRLGCPGWSRPPSPDVNPGQINKTYHARHTRYKCQARHTSNSTHMLMTATSKRLHRRHNKLLGCKSDALLKGLCQCLISFWLRCEWFVTLNGRNIYIFLSILHYKSHNIIKKKTAFSFSRGLWKGRQGKKMRCLETIQTAGGWRGWRKKCWEWAGNKKQGRIPVLCVLKRCCALGVKPLNCTLRGFLHKPETIAQRCAIYIWCLVKTICSLPIWTVVFGCFDCGGHKTQPLSHIGNCLNI